MKHSGRYIPGTFCGALVLGCVPGNNSDDTRGATASTSSTTSSNASGSVTSAPGSATDGTAGDSTPTMATAPDTSTGEACMSAECDDMNGTGECDNFAQDCPEGQKCAAFADDGGNSWNALHCVDVTDTDKPGEPCTYDGVATGGDSCIKGAMCWENVGTCLALCTGTIEDPVCDPSGPPCTIANGGVLNLCLDNCDPLAQDCPGTDLCIPIDNTFICVLEPGGPEEALVNDPCEFVNVCDEGLACLDTALVSAACDPAAGGCCTPFCQFPDGACPNPDQSCVQWFDPMMFPADDPRLDIGFCGIAG